jgi:hypothetical protein
MTELCRQLLERSGGNAPIIVEGNVSNRWWGGYNYGWTKFINRRGGNVSKKGGENVSTKGGGNASTKVEGKNESTKGRGNVTTKSGESIYKRR